MIRKITALLTVSLLTILGLVAANPAMADTGFSPTVTTPTDAYMGISFPMNDDKVIHFWVESDGGIYSLKSGILQSAGTFTNVTTVATAPNGTYIDYPSSGSVAISADGVVAITWIKRVEGDPQAGTPTVTTLNVSYSDDGTDWSEPLNLGSSLHTPDLFECRIAECGFQAPQIAFDRFGAIGIVLSDTDVSGDSRLLATSSRDGGSWAKLVQIQAAEHRIIQPSILAMPYGGFMSTWGSYETDWLYKYSTMTTSVLNYWKPAKNIGVYSAPVDKIVVQTFDSQISFFMSTNVSNTFTLYHRKFDIAAKTWTSDSTLFTRTNWLPRGEMSFDLGKNWHSAIGFGLLENGATNGAAYLVDINKSVPGAAQLVASTDQEQGLLLTGLSVNPDDSISFATTGMLNLRPYLKRVKAGVELLNVAVPTIADNQYLGFKGIATSNGNLYFFTAAGYTMRDAIVYVQATAPAASANASVRGTPRIGSKLTSGTVNFSSVSGIGATTRQWYSCTRPVPVNTTVKPSTCAAISKATGSTFKVTSKQRGKYITVALNNSNGVGTTALFAPVSSKAK